MTECPNKVCELKFETIDKRLEDGQGEFKGLKDAQGGHDIKIATLETNMISLTKSMDALTKSIWGASGTALIMALGFIFWYIQNKH